MKINPPVEVDSVHELHCTTYYPRRVLRIFCRNGDIVLLGRESSREEKRQKKKKGKISTDLASYVFNKSRPEMDINYKYKGTKGKLVWQGNLVSRPKRMVFCLPLMSGLLRWDNGFNGFTPWSDSWDLARYGRCHIDSTYLHPTSHDICIYVYLYSVYNILYTKTRILIWRGWLIHGTGIFRGHF